MYGKHFGLIFPKFLLLWFALRMIILPKTARQAFDISKYFPTKQITVFKD